MTKKKYGSEISETLAESKLEQFEREHHIKNGYVAGIKEGAEGTD